MCLSRPFLDEIVIVSPLTMARKAARIRAELCSFGKPVICDVIDMKLQEPSRYANNPRRRDKFPDDAGCFILPWTRPDIVSTA